jgi:hypothetical protein
MKRRHTEGIIYDPTLVRERPCGAGCFVCIDDGRKSYPFIRQIRLIISGTLHHSHQQGNAADSLNSRLIYSLVENEFNKADSCFPDI